MKVHEPVLLNETVDSVVMNKGGIYIDGTIGFAGHASKIISKLNNKGRLIGIDLDPYALKCSNDNLSKFPKKSYSLYKGNFSDFPNIIQDIGITKVDGLVIDLGISSYQIDSKHRGFSYRYNSDLDMRFDPTKGVSAKDFLNSIDEFNLGKTIKELGEEKQYKKIAINIVKYSKSLKMNTTYNLKEAIEEVSNKKHINKTLSRVFQAIRMKVNNEIDNLNSVLNDSLKYLKKGGRIAIITFHSIEDRIVKNFFKQNAITCICPHSFPICICNHQAKLKIINKKSICPSNLEIKTNPRSRSARLRVVECL
jgi:16S rRNA (cytosine1402-N4)-methyltransferase